ncbi:hypothetical protein KC723_02440 [Candidatus Kaiserbacteria bacterium]|nr:hypothetical protein [Candidatus Kaiserbacteria bacterium]
MRTTRDIQSPVCETVLVYRLTFRSQWVLCFILLLILSIFIQPINLAFANETEVTEVTEVTSAEPDKEEVKEVEEVTIEKSADDPLETEESITETEPNKTEEVSKQTVVDDIEEEAEVTETANATEEDVENDSSSSDNDDPVEEDIETETEVIVPVTTNTDKAENDVISDDSSSSSDSSDDDSNDEASTATDGVKSTTTTDFASSTEDVKASSTDDVNQESVEDIVEITTITKDDTDNNDDVNENDDVSNNNQEVTKTKASTTDGLASSTTDSASTSKNVVHVIKDTASGPLSFSDTDCMQIGNGSYYCEKNKNKNNYYESDEIFAAQDEDGDTEIYLRLKGNLTKLTDNKVDDDAPRFDSKSKQMVWHRLIEGRFQIVTYDWETKTEKQITQGTSNSSEPDSYDGVIVWQYWDGSDWEIMMLSEDEMIQVTDNEFPDLAPRINEEYIIWNTVHNGKKTIVIYEISTGFTELIHDSDEILASNPRLVMLYEAEYGNGDVVTRGFDLETGEIIPLTVQPKELPTKIPEPESTDEVKALITTKSTSRENKNSEDLDINTGLATSTNKTPSSSATTTVVAEEITDITDVIVEDFNTETPTGEIIDDTINLSGTSTIPDVVIPPIE